MRHLQSADLIKDYLVKNNVRIDQKLFGDSPFSRYLVLSLPNCQKKITLCMSKLSFPFDESRTAARLINRKDKTYDFAKQNGVNIPETMCVLVDRINKKRLRSFLRTHKRLIAKPSYGFQGRGLTVDITDFSSLMRAIKNAGHNRVIIQKQFSGQELRFITVDGNVEYVMLREKPFVIGDGRSTISQLINQEDKARRLLEDPMVEYPLLKDILPDEITLSERIPQSGENVELGQGSMIRTGASIYNIINKVDESYIKIVEKLARFFGNGVLSVDLMMPDYLAPATNSSYVFIEINMGISLPMCYSCRDGKNINIIEDFIGPKLLACLLD